MIAISLAPRRQRLDHGARRAQIPACARRLFSERHYASASALKIAREAGLARGLLHEYFSTRLLTIVGDVLAAVRRAGSNSDRRTR